MIRTSLLAILICLAGCGKGLPAATSAEAMQLARAGAADAQVPGGYTPIGTFPKSEGSGVVASRQYPGVYWAHRDSAFLASRTELYAFKVEHGRMVELSPGVMTREIDVQGATNEDWEDIALDAAGRLWIGNFGNNAQTRTDLCLYAMPEPDPYRDTTVKVLGTYPFSYPDRPTHGRSYNCESLFFVDNQPYVITKTVAPDVYRLPTLQAGVPTVLERVSELTPPPGGLGGKPTGADLSSDGARLAVTTDGGRVFVYDRANAQARGVELVKDLAGRAPRWSAHYNTSGQFEQVEGVAFTPGTYDLILLSESKKIFSFPAWFYTQP